MRCSRCPRHCWTSLDPLIRSKFSSQSRNDGGGRDWGLWGPAEGRGCVPWGAQRDASRDGAAMGGTPRDVAAIEETLQAMMISLAKIKMFHT